MKKVTGVWNFTKIGDVEYTVNGNRIQLKIPRSYLDFGSGKSIPSFNFKWTDNNLSAENADIMELYTKGNCAPGSRFTFVFDATEDTVYDPEYILNPTALVLKADSTGLTLVDDC